jgi:hypothetical protein
MRGATLQSELYGVRVSGDVEIVYLRMAVLPLSHSKRIQREPEDATAVVANFVASSVVISFLRLSPISLALTTTLASP